jgi:hypothetical protein
MITFEQANDGIGMNAVYHVLRDGKHVANISRDGRSTWRINSVHYWEPLGACRGIDEIKAKARAVTYPTAHEVYEKLCTATAIRRRNYIESLFKDQMALLIRALVSGSNSARTEMEELVTSMDAFIADRDDTFDAARKRADEHNEALGDDWLYRQSEWKYTESQRSYPYYPNQPQAGV